MCLFSFKKLDFGRLSGPGAPRPEPESQRLQGYPPPNRRATALGGLPNCREKAVGKTAGLPKPTRNDTAATSTTRPPAGVKRKALARKLAGISSNLAASEIRGTAGVLQRHPAAFGQRRERYHQLPYGRGGIARGGPQAQGPSLQLAQVKKLVDEGEKLTGVAQHQAALLAGRWFRRARWPANTRRLASSSIVFSP